VDLDVLETKKHALKWKQELVNGSPPAEMGTVFLIATTLLKRFCIFTLCWKTGVNNTKTYLKRKRRWSMAAHQLKQGQCFELAKKLHNGK
jgi:hypothetical protein